MLGNLVGLNKRPGGAAASSSSKASGAAAGTTTDVSIAGPVLKKRRIVHRPSAEAPSLLWVDKYRPLYLDEMELHPDFSKLMLDAAKSKELPHLLLYGPCGAGKMTRVYALMRQIFGHAVDDTQTKLHTVGDSSSNKFEICAKSSIYHLEINLSDVGFKDARVVKSLLKDFTSTKPLNRAAFKVVILKGADKLSNEAQTALRRLIEVRSEYNRFIFVSNSIGAMILPIQSRCFPYRLSLPTDAEITNVLKDVLVKEQLQPKGFSEQILNFPGIVAASRNDLRKALLILETMVTAAPNGVAPAQPLPIPVMPWEELCKSIAKTLLAGPFTPRSIIEVRSKFYTLLAATISSQTILTNICEEMCILAPMITELVWHVASVYDVTLAKAGKEIFALEAFAARMMAVIQPMQQPQPAAGGQRR